MNENRFLKWLGNMMKKDHERTEEELEKRVIATRNSSILFFGCILIFGLASYLFLFDMCSMVGRSINWPLYELLLCGFVVWIMLCFTILILWGQEEERYRIMLFIEKKFR